jgi:hypothetical protein
MAACNAIENESVLRTLLFIAPPIKNVSKAKISVRQPNSFHDYSLQFARSRALPRGLRQFESEFHGSKIGHTTRDRVQREM